VQRTSDGSINAVNVYASGSVGIGTSSTADAKLRVHIDTTGTSVVTDRLVAVVDEKEVAVGTGGGIKFGGVFATGGSPNPDMAFIKAHKENATSGNYSYAMVFGTRANGQNPTERMRIDSSGNVGVGTSSPTARLTVDGAINVKDNFALVLGSNQGGGASILYNGNGNLDITPRSGFSTVFTGGNVGIGTTTTLGSLDVARSGSHSLVVRTTSTGDPSINLQADGQNNGLITYSRSGEALTFSNGGLEGMRIDTSGNVGIGVSSPSRKLQGIVAGGSDRDMFLFGVSGLSNGVYWGWVNSTSTMNFRVASLPTTASAANAYLDGSADNQLYRSTSSIRYKKDIEDIDAEYSENALNLRPVWYRSKADGDNSKWSWYGLIAEEVAEIDPRLVHWSYADDSYEVEEVDGVIKKTPKPDAEMIPDGVQYERLSVLLLDLVKKQSAQIEALEARIEALEG